LLSLIESGFILVGFQPSVSVCAHQGQLQLFSTSLLFTFLFVAPFGASHTE